MGIPHSHACHAKQGWVHELVLLDEQQHCLDGDTSLMTFMFCYPFVVFVITPSLIFHSSGSNANLESVNGRQIFTQADNWMLGWHTMQW